MTGAGKKAMTPTDRRPWMAALVLAAALVSGVPGVCIAAPGAEPSDQACPGLAQVVVRAAAATDAAAVCDGAGRALGFLARAGLAPPSFTLVEILDRLPGALDGRAVGCYLRETRSIQLLSYAAFAAIGTWFRMPVDAELYRAVAAHEMAHAVVGCNAGPASLPVAAHEYVAYVALFATMEPRLRERLLAKFSGSGFGSTLEINDMNHFANPNQFGVDAWRDYLRRKDRDAWLREVIAGRVVDTWPTDGP